MPPARDAAADAPADGSVIKMPLADADAQP